MTAGQWFYVSGFLTFMFGLGLLSLALARDRDTRRRRRRPVRTIERARLYEASLVPIDVPTGAAYAVGLGFAVESARVDEHRRVGLAATRVMPRVRP